MYFYGIVSFYVIITLSVLSSSTRLDDTLSSTGFPLLSLISTLAILKPISMMKSDFTVKTLIVTFF